MSHAIDAVVGERHGKTQLDEELGGEGQSAKCSCNRGGFEVPAENGRDEISSGKGVESAGGDGTRNSVQTTGVPGDLRAVDAQVRRDRAPETLLSENFVGICCCGCC